jgi:hypothetical protein
MQTRDFKCKTEQYSKFPSRRQNTRDIEVLMILLCNSLFLVKLLGKCINTIKKSTETSTGLEINAKKIFTMQEKVVM